MTKMIKVTDLIDLVYRARPIFGHYFESFMNEVSQLPVEDIKTVKYAQWIEDRKSTRLNSSHEFVSRMPSSA